MDTWIVLVNDRHADVDALPFSRRQDAEARARELVPDGTEPEELTGSMLRDGWVLDLSYGTEGEYARVIRRTMDKGRP
ncbi:MAG TPA: hypothetical protein VHT94_07355 [Streptosporangiaceae bacterium]|jgi:hypothetical protein|nr:hypothetical protein [Streptosporangiaceae bacterium]